MCGLPIIDLFAGPGDSVAATKAGGNVRPRVEFGPAACFINAGVSQKPE